MKLIINADDFGLSETCTRAIFDAFNKGLITDTTMVANGGAFDLALNISQNSDIKNNIGVHFNLTEGAPLTENIKKCSSFVMNGRFHGKVNRTKPLSRYEKKAVYEELTAQIEKIENSGIRITHADSHHHIHTDIFIAPIVVKICKEHGINKIRLHRNIGSISIVKKIVKKIYNRYLKFKGFRTTDYFGSLEDIKDNLPSDTLEIMVHPDYNAEGILIDRIDLENGYPVGEKLNENAKKISKNHFSYNEL